MVPARWTHIPAVLETHMDELAFLWSQRQAQLRDHGVTAPTFRELEARIAAHRDGIRAVGAEAWPALEERLATDDAFDVFVGAIGLLDPAAGARAETVVESLAEAGGPKLDGLKMALSHGGARTRDIARVRATANPAVSAAAAEILAFHRALERNSDEVDPLLSSDDPTVRAAGWRVVACSVMPVAPERYAAAARDEDRAVVVAALEAGAWCGVTGVLEAVRRAATTDPAGQIDVLHLLAILGTDADVPLLRDIAANAELGGARFAIIAAGGRTELIPWLLDGMASDDAEVAAAAGAAFTKLTGLNIDSERVATVGPEDADEFEKEFADTVTLPDPEAARREWELLRRRLNGARYLAQGRDIGALDAAVFAHIDMRSRFEVCLRARFYGKWSGTVADLERHPQRH